MTSLIFDGPMKRILILLIMMVFAVLLLYTNYLQEVNFFQNKLQLNEILVDFNTYKLLQETSSLNQNQLKQFREKLESEKLVNKDISDKHILKTSQDKQVFIHDDINTEELDNMQYFSLNPPFPDIDLTSIGPVFIENGFIHLYCEYSFDTIRCTIGGKIPAEKIYFPTAYFTNPNFEDIVISFSFKEIIKIFEIYKSETILDNNKPSNNLNIGWLNYQILISNIPNIELFTNYIMLFGSNGTNLNLFSKPEVFLLDEENESEDMTKLNLSKKYKYYKFIHTQVCLLFILIYLKLINFILFGFTLLFQFGIHFPIYLFTFFKYGKQNINADLEKQNEEMNMNGFEEWIKNNELIEDRLLNNENDTLNIIKARRMENKISTSVKTSNLRMRKESTQSKFFNNELEGFSTGIEETESMRLKDIRRLYYDEDDSVVSKITNSTEIQSNEYVASPLLTTYGNDNRENQSMDLPLFQKSIILSSSLDEFVDKYYLFYTVTCIFFLFHLLIYGFINLGLYNMISESFEVLSTCNSNNLNIKDKSFFKIPEIIIGVTTRKNGSNSLFTHGNMIFACLINLSACTINLILSILFHTLYIFCMYTYTLSIY